MGLGSNNVPTGWGAGEDSLDRIFKREEQQKQDLIKWWKEVKEIAEHHVYLNELIFNDNEDYIVNNLEASKDDAITMTDALAKVHPGCLMELQDDNGGFIWCSKFE